MSFVFTAFLLTASVSTPIVGRLGDLFGKQRMLVFSLWVATIAIGISGRASQKSHS